MTKLSEMADKLMQGEAVAIPMSDTPSTPTDWERAKVVHKAMKAQLDELLELRKQERWNEDLDKQAERLSIQVGTLGALINLYEQFGS